jgi:phosphatidylglycerol:prolipoprotein diacylglycerol transferase
MHPILIQIGPVTIPTYGFLFAIGAVLGILVDLRLARREGIDMKVYGDFIFYILLLSLLGAKIFLFLTNAGYYLRFPSELKYLLTSGGTFYGGLIAGVLFAVWFIRRHKLNFRRLGDVSVPGLALGHFFGRLGCFGAGCCYGREADRFPLSVIFSSEKAHSLTGVPLGVPLFPTQAMEALLNLFRKRRYAGQVFALYILNYSLIRFFIEYFRGDEDRGFVWNTPGSVWLSLSIPQLISICGIVLALVLFRVYKSKGEKENLS